MLNTPIGDYNLKAFSPCSDVFVRVCLVSYSHFDLPVSLACTSVWWNFGCCNLICHSCNSDPAKNRWDLHVLHVHRPWAQSPYRDLEMFHLKTWYILIKLRQGDRVIHQLCLHLKEMKYVIIVRSIDIMALLCKILGCSYWQSKWTLPDCDLGLVVKLDWLRVYTLTKIVAETLLTE